MKKYTKEYRAQIVKSYTSTSRPLSELYKELYEIVNKKNKSIISRSKKEDSLLTICPAIAGSSYKSGGLMFVGRSINSWCPLSESIRNDESFSDRIKRCERCTLDWVMGNNVWTHCVENGCPYAQKNTTGEEPGDHDRIINSKFFQFVKWICDKELTDAEKQTGWNHNIVWSNLYKTSYSSGGNPTGFYTDQILLCNAILIKEIEKYKPRKIFFITEKNRRNLSNQDQRTWFCREDYPTDEHFQELYDYLGEKEWEDKVIVLKRPEGKSFDEIWDDRESLDGKKIQNMQ